MRAPLGGWLIVLCVLLLVWQPLNLGFAAASALEALPIRGLPLALVLCVRVVAAAVGIAAGLALAAGRPGAVTLAKAALIASAVSDMVVYGTPWFPNNRLPGTTPLYVAASLTYHAAWLVYLFRSKRVRSLL